MFKKEQNQGFAKLEGAALAWQSDLKSREQKEALGAAGVREESVALQLLRSPFTDGFPQRRALISSSIGVSAWPAVRSNGIHHIKIKSHPFDGFLKFNKIIICG